MTIRTSSRSRPSAAIFLLIPLLAFVAATASHAQGFSVAYSDVEFVVSPGETVTTSIKVTNLSDRAKVLRVYGGDWVRVREGITDYVFEEEPGQEVRSLLPWMIFSPDQIELEAGETREVYCEVEVPEDPALEGSYWGVIFIQDVPLAEPGFPAPSNNSMNVGINTIFRYAVKIFATIEGTEVREGSFTDLFIEQVADGFDVTAVFDNPGNIYMRPKAWLEVRDTAGNSIYQQEHIRQTILPESTHEYKFELEGLSLTPGSYLVMVIADYGASTLIAAQARMEIKAEQIEPDEQ